MSSFLTLFYKYLIFHCKNESHFTNQFSINGYLGFYKSFATTHIIICIAFHMYICRIDSRHCVWLLVTETQPHRLLGFIPLHKWNLETIHGGLIWQLHKVIRNQEPSFVWLCHSEHVILKLKITKLLLRLHCHVSIPNKSKESPRVKTDFDSCPNISLAKLIGKKTRKCNFLAEHMAVLNNLRVLL